MVQDVGATVLNVEANGSGPYPDIASAITAAVDGDIIELGDGIYTGAGNRDLDLAGKTITIRSGSGNAEAVRIDCEGSVGTTRRAFFVDSGEGPGTVIESLTIENGSSMDMLGIVYVSQSSLSLVNVIFQGNYSDAYGGACPCLGSRIRPPSKSWDARSSRTPPFRLGERS